MTINSKFTSYNVLNTRASTKIEGEIETISALNHPSDSGVLQIIVFRLVNIT